MAKKTTTYQKDLIEGLKDSREAAAYLNAAMEEGDRGFFLLALRNVADTHDGKSCRLVRTHGTVLLLTSQALLLLLAQ